ncbi:Probable alanine aminotransferase, mitochondrial [Aduncisulcus paluster]|uniref:Probable alanine aminotransferase, mitochondrial n=1 Tax=Aduncisulcus paluster TaxID=2918883 RepID=A0ABQ5KA47_9EUKA|nr:Probable alanine aminotransferase, mitochondrial [Aduncisulcus paluster]|eukprot:gnl/Carplike_NY0171/962_a1321_1610.p1 GENE.gnl/Carplike_NY0171/962_a1321_1610~~gnl/Carplike_NY0171/962_a1321_1610.p1  ORF type:complete len:480 (-),score=190.84 gnl/Carplike_NY0171/962_a1321_1610:198-1637(-)
MPKLTIETINPKVVEAKYAVRGAVPIRAGEIKKDMQIHPEKYPFDSLIMSNIGNPHALMQKPLSFHREVLSLVSSPFLLEKEEILKGHFSPESIKRAKDFMASIPVGTGAYTNSKGFEFVRKHVAEYIEERDGFPANPENIYLTDGASAGVKNILQLIASPGDGVMIPIPQYPLYSATLSLLGAKQIDYFLDEDDCWGIKKEELLRSYAAADTTIRALCVINPGNPVGAVLVKKDIEDIISFCHEKGILLMADEVYQINCYKEEKPFISFKKTLCEMERDGRIPKGEVELVSFHSVSKGIIGECGLRGGYMEVVNIDEEVLAQVYKMASVSLCPNTTGQLVVDLMIHPPTEPETRAIYDKEVSELFMSLKRRAKKVGESLTGVEGIHLNPVEGAMYAFPRIDIPEKAVAEAKKRGVAPDVMYCLDMLEEVGVCTVPGSGFGQRPGTFHVRFSFLPLEEVFDSFMDRVIGFHKKFLAKWK